MKKLIFKKFLWDVTAFFILTTISVSIIIWVIQAVNYLDFVSEDGHSFKVYFMYTFLSFPKIVSRILPFMFFLSLYYIYLKYEDNNELIIFWLNGVKKIDFVKKVVSFSFLFLFFQVFLTCYLVPVTQDLGRSYIRASTIDFFPSLIKEKKFIDTVSNLTIFIEEKDRDGRLKNIFLKDKISDSESQTIYAREGSIIKEKNSHYLILNDGKIINIEKNKKNIFSFDKTRFNLSKYSTKTTTFPKIQELKTNILLSCIYNLYNNSLENFEGIYLQCNFENKKPVLNEIFRRVFLPLYLPLIALITSFLLLTSKDQFNFKSYKLKIFLLSIFSIIISEFSVRYSGINLKNNIIFITLPIILFLVTLTIFKQRTKKS